TGYIMERYRQVGRLTLRKRSFPTNGKPSYDASDGEQHMAHRFLALAGRAEAGNLGAPEGAIEHVVINPYPKLRGRGVDHIPFAVPFQVADEHADVVNLAGGRYSKKDQVARLQLCRCHPSHPRPLAGRAGWDMDTDLSVAPLSQAGTIELFGTLGAPHIG